MRNCPERRKQSVGGGKYLRRSGSTNHRAPMESANKRNDASFGSRWKLADGLDGAASHNKIKKKKRIRPEFRTGCCNAVMFQQPRRRTDRVRQLPPCVGYSTVDDGHCGNIGGGACCYDDLSGNHARAPPTRSPYWPLTGRRARLQLGPGPAPLTTIFPRLLSTSKIK